MRKKIILCISLIVGILLVGCGKENTESVDLSQRNLTRKELEDEVNSEILTSPKELNSEFVQKYFTLYIGEKPVMIFEMKEKDSSSLSYVISRMQDDYTWKSEKVDWENRDIKKKQLTLLSVAMNKRNEMWGIFANLQSLGEKNGSTMLFRLSSDEPSEPVELKEATGKGMLYNVFFVSDDKLAMQFAVDENSSAEEDSSPVYTIIYDTVNEKVLLENNKIGLIGQNVDENLVACSIDEENKCIIGRKIGETIPEFALKCGKELPAAYSIIRKADSVYYILDDGIYGGKVSDKECKKLISSDKMVFPSKTSLNEEMKQYQDSITNDMAVVSFCKVPGDDKEFLCLTKKDYSSQEVQWVHYYE